ncbi:MAG: PilZ domain-containing protein [Candidatus Omnitrophica bacterium]|nr:PilZ domain-containing protein [Candidatus Omnitrophota bacterium]
MDEQNNKESSQPQGPQEEEKRLSPRIKKEILVRYKVKVEYYGDIDMSSTRDLSETGISFTAARAFSPGTVLTLGLRFPAQKDFLQFDARVVSCKSKAKIIHTVRAEFIDLNEEQKKALKEFVQFFLKG